MNRDEALAMSDQSLKELAEALKQGKSEQLLAYLDTLSKFHQYSFGNCMLIYMQRPNATLIAGFERWKELGRYVKKGEKGIGILAPLLRKRKKDEASEETKAESSDAETKPESSRVLYGFRVVHVFDVSQTDGQDLADFAKLDGDPGDKIERLEQVIRSHGIALEFVDDLPFSANGMSEGGKVSIVSSLPKPQKFSTMVHELAHELLHWGDRRESTTKTVRETEAEAVAYVVCRAVGLECSTRASDYIQLWSGDEKVLLQSLEHIRSVASKVLAELADVTVESKEATHVA